MKNIKSMKETLNNLIKQRAQIFNSLDSRISRYNLKANTHQLVMATGFCTIEVECIYDSAYCYTVKN